MNFTIAKGIQIDLRWRTITDSGQSDWLFSPDVNLSESAKGIISGPRIYRFYFHSAEGNPRCYIGESENFQVRCGKYLRALTKLRQKPTADVTAAALEEALKKLHSDSCVRVAAEIINAELDKTLIELQLLDFEDFSFNRAFLSTGNTTNPFVRRAIENLAILDTDSSGVRVLNRGRDVRAKEFTQLLKSFRNTKETEQDATQE